MAELEKTPTANVSVNKPASGTYGEHADRERLKQALPMMAPAPIPQPTPPPIGPPPNLMPADNGGRPKAAPRAVPGSVLHPTTRPGVPTQTPLTQGPAPVLGGAQSQVQARMFLLQTLASSPDVSAETREWARTVLEMLGG